MVARTADTTATVTFGVSPYTHEQAWALAGRLSPRPVIRVAARAATGEILNEYDRLWPLNEPAPTTTWAMLLADDDHRFVYLCFDFDSSSGNAARDADKMSYWLNELNVPHLVCVSGPTGGRHIWVRLDEPTDATVVRELAQLAKSLLPSLDTKPLLNPAAGCVRPPYAPHRVHGYSDPQGSLTLIEEHSAPEEFPQQLRELLEDLGAELPAVETAPVHGMVVDKDGHPRLRGVKRPLSMKMDAVLHGPAGEDASYTLAQVLAACADAHWSYRDVAALVPTAPALEHVRTRRVGDHRARRSAEQMEKVLTGAWKHAVTFVATNPRTGEGDDASYRERVAAVTETVARVLAAADARPGLWSTGNRRTEGSHAQRTVLDALCLYMLQSARHTVEADVRRLAADTGYGRNTVSVALRALAAGDSPWVERVGVPEGVHAQKYRLHTRFSTGTSGDNRTQARMRAFAHPLPTQQALTREIGTRLGLLRHDVFCAPGSLGRMSGLLYKTLPAAGSMTMAELVMRTGMKPDRARHRLNDLVAHGLVERVDGGWRRLSPTVRDFIARQLEVSGYLADRRDRYENERLLWAWWQAEITWMEKKAKHRRGRKSLHYDPDRPDYAPFPRGPTKKCDYAQAAKLVKAGYLDRGLALAA